MPGKVLCQKLSATIYHRPALQADRQQNRKKLSVGTAKFIKSNDTIPISFNNVAIRGKGKKGKESWHIQETKSSIQPGGNGPVRVFLTKGYNNISQVARRGHSELRAKVTRREMLLLLTWKCCILPSKIHVQAISLQPRTEIK